MAGILCSGDVYFDRQNDNGVSTGLVHIGNTTQFQITEASTIQERKSRMKKSYGQVLDSSTTKEPAKLALTLDEMNRPNLALVCLGKDTAKDQAAATAQTKEFDLTGVDAGIAYEIGHRMITVGSVKIGTEVVPAADYEIDETGGLITFADTIAATGTLTVTYAAAALAGYQISGGASPVIKGRLLLIGMNLVNKAAVEVNALEVTLTPKNGLDFLSSSFASAQFEGTLNTPAGQSSPYTVTVLQAA